MSIISFEVPDALATRISAAISQILPNLIIGAEAEVEYYAGFSHKPQIQDTTMTYVPTQASLENTRLWKEEHALRLHEKDLEDDPLFITSDEEALNREIIRARQISAPIEAIEPVVGQVRILRPEMSDVMMHRVLVLAVDDSDGTVLIIPFSSYFDPAISGEIALEDADEIPRTLQTWAATWVPKDVIITSFHESSVSPESIAAVNNHMAWLYDAEELTLKNADLIGAPIEDENDVRLEYQQEVIASLQKLHAAAVDLD